ncbi:hypothetical protein HQQ80_01870 [Microbacteriaceae bacterium VKM Ac-2855]|nr:hypothetical protein [Microbacteriaceae bacterium VKM Ac-2855]
MNDTTAPESGRAVGSPAWCGRLLRSTLSDTLPLIVEALGTAADLPTGAPRTILHDFVSNHEHAEFLGGIVLQSKIDMERSIRAVADYVSAIVTLLETGGDAVVSVMALSRSAGESVLRFCHIHDPTVTPARTLTRMAAYQLESIEDNLRTAEAFGEHGEDDAREARENIATMHRYLTDHGFSRLPGQRRPEFTVNITLAGETQNVSFNATDAYRRYLAVGYWDWAIGSGATHGRGWLLPNIVGTFDEEPFMERSDVATTVTLQLLELADAFATAIGGHTGISIENYKRKIHQRRIGATAADRPHDGQAVSHRDYGLERAAPSFPLGTDGSSFRGTP